MKKIEFLTYWRIISHNLEYQNIIKWAKMFTRDYLWGQNYP